MSLFQIMNDKNSRRRFSVKGFVGGVSNRVFRKDPYLFPYSFISSEGLYMWTASRGVG